jgi:hypothetical protein
MVRRLEKIASDYTPNVLGMAIRVCPQAYAPHVPMNVYARSVEYDCDSGDSCDGDGCDSSCDSGGCDDSCDHGSEGDD